MANKVFLKNRMIYIDEAPFFVTHIWHFWWKGEEAPAIDMTKNLFFNTFQPVLGQCFLGLSPKEQLALVRKYNMDIEYLESHNSFEKIIEMAKKYDAKVMPQVNLMIVPDSFLEKYPEARIPLLKTDNIYELQPCLLHPAYRNLIRKTISVVIARSKTVPRIGWYWADELSQNARPCSCPNCQKAYRKWLKAKYTTISKLNKSWSTNYSDWSQIKLMEIKDYHSHPDFTQEFADYQAFRVWYLKNFVRYVTNTIKELDPDHSLSAPIINTIWKHAWWMPPAWYEIGKYIDILRYQAFPKRYLTQVGLCYSLAREFGNGVMNMWHLYTVEEQKRVIPITFSAIFRGAKTGIGWYYYQHDKPGQSQGLVVSKKSIPDKNGIIHYEKVSERHPIYDLVSKLNKKALKLTDIFSRSDIPRAEVAILFSGLAVRLGTNDRYVEDLESLLRLFRDIHIPVDILWHQQAGALLEYNYKVLILPSCTDALPKQTLETIKSFIRKGGYVICARDALSKNEIGQRIDLEAHGFSELFGVKEGGPISGKAKIISNFLTPSMDNKAEFILKDAIEVKPLAGVGGLPRHLKVIASIKNVPVITLYDERIMYVGGLLGTSYFETNTNYISLIEGFLKKAGITKPVVPYVDNREEFRIEIELMKGKNFWVVGLMNHTESKKQVNLKFNLFNSGEYRIIDPIRGKTVIHNGKTIWSKEDLDNIKIVVDSLDAEVLVISSF
ncbi:beta-galactosidase [Candidatus Calescamantes bacterium]|nr:beta-galactosidase [Candidatus Calescamantes bacterium]